MHSCITDKTKYLSILDIRMLNKITNMFEVNKDRGKFKRIQVVNVIVRVTFRSHNICNDKMIAFFFGKRRLKLWVSFRF